MTSPQPGQPRGRVIPRPLPGRDDEMLWSYLQAGEVRIQQCQACGQWRYPATPVCARCLSDDTQWRPIAGLGTLQSWATFHRRYFPMIDPPYTVVAVALEEGPILCGDLRGPVPARLELGQRMTVTIEPAVLDDGQPCPIFGWRVAIPSEPANKKDARS
jgi:uncharacterized protein